MKAQLGSVTTRLDSLEKVADDLTIKFDKKIQAETINYGGGGWIVLGACLIIIIFLSAFGITLYLLVKKTNLLKLVTCAVSKTSDHTRRAVKEQVEKEVRNGGSFKPRHQVELADFAKKCGTFAENVDP